MHNVHYFIAFILIVGWAIGFFGYAQGGLIHLILVIGTLVPFVRFTGSTKIILRNSW